MRYLYWFRAFLDIPRGFARTVFPNFRELRMKKTVLGRYIRVCAIVGALTITLGGCGSSTAHIAVAPANQNYQTPREIQYDSIAPEAPEDLLTAVSVIEAGEMVSEIPYESDIVSDAVTSSPFAIEAKIAECVADLQTGLDLMLLGRTPSVLDMLGADDGRFMAVVFFESKVTEMLEVVGSYRAYDLVIQEIGNYCTMLQPTVWPPVTGVFIPHPLVLLLGN